MSRHFLDWEKPLISGAIDWLKPHEEQFSETLVIVPTSNSGRRLRQAMSADGGMLIPRVATPDVLFADSAVQSSLLTQLVWVRLLQEESLANYPSLYPQPSDGELSLGMALPLARQLLDLRETLADGNLSFEDARRASPEKERWDDLLRLEEKFLAKLKHWKMVDVTSGKQRRATHPKLPPGITRVVLAALPDPSGLAVVALENLAASGVKIDVLIHAEDSLSESFDVWGRPQVSEWSQRRIELPREDHLHVCADSTAVVERCVEVISECQVASDELCMILCDSELGSDLSKRMSREGWELLDVQGGSLSGSVLLRHLECLRELLRPHPPMAVVNELLRLPGSESLLPDGMSRHHVARRLDEFTNRHLPQTLSDGLALADDELRDLLAGLKQTLDGWQTDGGMHDLLESHLGSLLSRCDPSSVKAATPIVEDGLDVMDFLKRQALPITSAEVLHLIIDGLNRCQVSAESRGTHLDLQGWLEVSYDASPHLILVGMHEGCVPDGQADHPFLPDSMRADLGLRDAALRAARDAYLLESAIVSRRVVGRVDFFTAHFTSAGETRKPSRLLMRCEPEQLAQRVKHLFRERKPIVSTNHAWKRDWQLTLPHDMASHNPYSPDQGHKALSPSALKDYLKCPFRFYLKRVVKMDRFTAGKMEMDALDFGNLCHYVMEKFGENKDYRDCTDANELAEVLSGLLDERVSRIYGSKLSLPLMVQRESARERLRAFAEHQAQDRAEGWQILHTEFSVGRGEVGSDEFVPWSVAGHPIVMMPDRIDRHQDGKRWRVWDYKTFGTYKEPNKTHLVGYREGVDRVPLADLHTVTSGRSKGEHRWAELQLPLYAEFVRQHFGCEELPQIGYVSLPRSIDDVGFTRWNNYDEAIHENALEWAEAAIAAIEQGVFTPPSDLSGNDKLWDEFVELAPDGLGAAFGLS